MTDVRSIAARCIQDPAFAREVLAGDAHPEVQAAIAADAVDGAEVSGFFNPQPDPPGAQARVTQFDKVSSMWGQLALPSLHTLAGLPAVQQPGN